MASETDVSAKVALVTGSSSGIGEAAVKQLAREGYKVAVCGSKQEKVDRVCSECAKLSPNSFEVSCSLAPGDVSPPRSSYRLIGRQPAAPIVPTPRPHCARPPSS